MINNYKFQDLAKFIDDLKFLIGRDGGAGLNLSGVMGGGSTIEIIFRVIWLFLLWVLLVIIIYVIYKVLFYGYPRFPIDLIRFKFNNKVNVKSVVGGINGPLYKYIVQLKDDRLKDTLQYFNKQGFKLLKDDCNNDNCESIFAELDNIVSNEYHEFNVSKVEEALSDYYKYYTSITFSLGLNIESPQNRVAKLRSILNTVFADYLKYYRTEILRLENTLLCKKNTGKDPKSRENETKDTKRLEGELALMLKSINCKKITTDCEFAKLFLDPQHNLDCNDKIGKLVEKQLKSMGVDTLRKRYRQLRIEINRDNRAIPFKTGKARKRAKERVSQKKFERGKISDQIDEMKVKAEAIVKKSLADKINNISTSSNSKSIIAYQSEDKVFPNIERNKELQYTVYVPCYDLYKQYYIVNKDKMFANFSSPSGNGMTEDEVVAFIFLTDIEKLMENAHNKNKLLMMDESENDGEILKKPTLIERFLNTYIGIETVAGSIREVLTSPKSPIEVAQYLTFIEDKNLVNSIAELQKNQSIIKDYYNNYGLQTDSPTFLEDYENTDALNIVNDYTFYLMEILAYIDELQGEQPSSNYDYVYQRYAKHMSLLRYNPSLLIAYLNLPLAQQKEEDIMKKFGITKRVANFVRSHPIFSMLYLSNSRGIEVYHEIMKMFLDLCSDNKPLLDRLFSGTTTLEDKQEIVFTVRNKVSNIKEVIVSLHMMNLYFTFYRDSVSERDPVTKVKISRDGLVDIYEQQNISSEFASFFGRLFEPFKREFLDGRIKTSWRKAFLAKRFESDLKKDKLNISYWRDFNSFWVDYMGKKMDGMIKGWWRNFSNYSRSRY